MSDTPRPPRTMLHRLRRLLYWLLPVVILTAIFSRMDGARLWALVRQVHPGWLILGWLSYPLACVAGAWRWQTLLTVYLGRRLPFGFLLRHYFIGHALGFFAPASAGWDVYRVAAAGRTFGHYRKNIAAILVEKFMAVLSAGLLVFLLLPVVRRWAVPAAAPWLSLLHHAALAGLALCGATLGALILLARNRAADLAARRIQMFFTHLLARTGAGPAAEDTPPPGLGELVRPVLRPGAFVRVLLLSVLIQSITSLGGVFKFRSLGLAVPFWINFFVVPILLFIFILPISFGSLGVREGSNILLYGLFGIPAEAALVVSILGLGGLLLNQVIGALALWRTGAAPPKP